MPLKCISLNGITQTQKDMHYTIPFIRHSCKCKTIETENMSVVPGLVRRKFSTTKGFREIWGIGVLELFLYLGCDDIYTTFPFPFTDFPQIQRTVH